jgi:gamma-glutamylcyclotransferase (GGCT)/AIG2-like uncharacterized protein YtfP
MKYFAYGSNMCTNWLRSRVPSCRFHAVGTLKGYVLKFHKRSMDGSGKCNAFLTNDENDGVMGVIFELNEAEKPALDRAEGLGNGYHEIDVRVLTACGTVTARMYVADPNAVDDSLAPYTWYKDIVVGGAREHGLPEAYIQSIETIGKARVDPDPQREADRRRFLPCNNEHT